MKTLPIRLLPVDHESLSDYVDRLADANGYSGNELWHILSQEPGRHEELLSHALNGQLLPAFSGPAVQRIDIPVKMYGMRAIAFTRARRRWCPVCVSERPILDPVWRLKVCTVCATHRVQLLQECPDCQTRVHIRRILAGHCECGCRFAGRTTTADKTEVALASTLKNSLTGEAFLELGAVAPILDTPQLIHMIHYVGRLSEGPSLRRPGQIQNLEDLNVASQLFKGTASMLSNWPDNFWRCLEDFMRTKPNDASVRRVFGELYQVIYRHLVGGHFQFWRDAFEQFLLEHWRGELTGRHRLFDAKTIQSHRLHGLSRIARASGLSGQTVKRMVYQNCFPANHFSPDSKRKLITIDKAILGHIIPDPTAYLDLRRTARLFGIKPFRLRQLVAHGAILADAKPNWGRSNRWHFRRDVVEDLIQNIRISQTPIDQAATTTLTFALRFWRVKAAEFGALILAVKQGQIAYKLSPEQPLSKLTFHTRELKLWLESFRRGKTDWISVTAAAAQMRLKEQVVYELVARNLLLADVTTKHGHTLRRISLSSIDTFQKEFISAADLARKFETSASAILRRVNAAPASGPRIDGGRQYFFRRADVSTLDLHAPR